MFRLSQFIAGLLSPDTRPTRTRPPGAGIRTVVIWNLVRRCNLTCLHCYAFAADHEFPGELTTAQALGVLDDLLSHLRLESASVLGLSLGGMMAQELAHRSPGRVDRLVLASTCCGWNADPQTSTLFATPARRRARRRDARSGVRRPRSEQELSFLELQWELRQLYRPSVRGLRLGLVAAFTWSSRPWLHTLDMPVLVLHGTEDAVLPVANGRIIAATVPNGRLELYQDAGHLAVLQQPARTAGLISDFVRTT